MTAALWFTSVWTHSVFGLMSQSNVHEEIGETEDLLAASQEGDLPKTPSKALKRPATAKPKAQGNAKGKPTIKASNKGKNKKVRDGDKPTLKRPAAAAKKKGQGPSSKGGRSWAKALDKEEEPSEEQPEEEELERDPEETDFAMDQGEECEVNKKDKSKDAKFKKLLAQRQLPSKGAAVLK